MLTVEERILSQLLISRRLVSREELEAFAGKLDPSRRTSLVDALIADGTLDRTTGRQLADEARDIGALLAPQLGPDRRLGEFRLLSEIGRGGMGIVYEAEQESLGRRVALKVLPAGAALDERLAARFLREARAAGRLHHAGIVPVHASGREEGVLYFAMELVEGGSLADRISRGPLPPSDAARLAAEAARALDHAHEAGLVHRDVKPENILVGSDGHARIADFGLVQESRAGSVTLSHFVLGTPAYAAPEQARGEPVDRRTDVYALGAVLYSMLTGRSPYDGEVPGAVLGRVLTEEPPALSAVSPGLPERLVAVCERAMARDPSERYASAAELADDLERYLRGETPAAASLPLAASDARTRTRTWLAWAVAVVVVAAVVAALVLSWPRRPRTPPPPRLGVLEGAYRLVAERAEGPPALSPDGLRLAYQRRTGNEWDVFLETFGGGPPVNLTSHLAGSRRDPAFSPDGTRLSLCAMDGSRVRIEVMDLATRTVHALSELVDERGRSAPSRCGAATWSPDGREIVFAEKEPPHVGKLWGVEVGSGRTRVITSMLGSSPRWSPGGGRIAYAALSEQREDIWTIPAAGGVPVRVTDDASADWSPAWSPDGTLLYFGSDRHGHADLWRVRIDEASGEILGEPEPVTRGFMATAFDLAAARATARMAFRYRDGRQHLYRVPFDAAAGRIAGPPVKLTPELPVAIGFPHPSPVGDGLVAAARSGDHENLRLLETSRRDPSFLTDGPFRDSAPRWSPDGARIAFHSNRSGSPEIWLVGADGTGLRRLTDTPGADAVHPVWSPDGARIAFTIAGEGGFVIELDGESAPGRPVPLPALPDFAGFFEPWSWSPDGAEIAGTAGGIVVCPPGDGVCRRLTGFGEKPAWVGRTGALLFVHEGRIHVVERRGGESRVVFSAEPNRLSPFFSVDRAGGSIYCGLSGSEDRVWMLEPEPVTE